MTKLYQKQTTTYSSSFKAFRKGTKRDNSKKRHGGK